MITNTYTPHVGGVARSVSAFSECFRDRGHRVLVIAPEFEPKAEEESDVIRIPSIKNFNHCDHIIVPSQSIQSILRKRGLKRPSTVIPTGVDVARFASGSDGKLREELGIGKKDLVVGHAGRLAPEKNLEFLTLAVAQFLKNHPRAHFLVVGEGPSRLTMQRIFEDSKLSERIRFLGVTKGQRLVDAYHAMDVFAFASKTETQGMVLTESMAAGVPVIALDAPGAREVVRNRINGQLLKDHSLESFGSALEWFSDLSQRPRKTLYEKALSTAKDFSISRCADKCLNLYRSTISIKSKSHRLYPWEKGMRMFQSEWEIFKNFVHAARKTWIKL